MEWEPYKSCCFENVRSLDLDAACCPQCGHTVMRCLGFADCGKLVSPREACPGCVAPQLMIKAGAIVGDKAGHVMSVPLVLVNQSSAGRPLWVKRITRVDGRNEESLTIPFEHVDAHEECEFTLDTAPLAEGGTYTLNLRLVLAARYKNVEEEYAFAAGITVSAATQEKGKKKIINKVATGNVEGAGAAGHMIGGTINLAGFDKPTTALADKQVVRLQRAERYEIEQGIRGYRKEGLRVLRNVDFAFSGFRSEDTPAEGPSLLSRGRLLFGRNSRPPVAEGTTPNDVCLRAFDARTKQVDEPATMAISRHHFDLVVVNDRLAVQVKAPGGMQVNGETLAAGQVFPIAPGDRIIPIPGRGDKLTLRVGFTNGIGVVNRIDVSRTPPIPK